MTKHLRKLLALLLALSLLLGVFPTALAASAEKNEPSLPSAAGSEEAETDAPMPNGMHVQTPYGLRLGSGRTETRGETKDLPAYYNSADEGLVTSVKNQTQYGNYGTCWAFGTISPIETYMIKNQMPIGESGVTSSTDMDLSEYHLSYFTYSNSYDEHGLTNGDSSILDASHLNVGGDGYKATLTLMRWIGAASEEEADLAYSEASLDSTIDPKYAYAYDIGHVTSVDWIEPSDVSTVKQYLQQFGSAFIGYYYNPAYQGTGGAYCYISTSASNDYGPNHGVTLVGWDDNYSKSNFTGLSKPMSNGAWIIKNSWGNSSATDNGYTYISYEDTSYLGHPIMFFTVDTLDAYDHLYQYDGTCFTGNSAKGWIPLTQNRSLISNVFTAAGHETVEAFSICTLEENMGYKLEVYKNPTNLTGSSPDPTSGSLMSTQTGTIAHGGYHTIRIATPFKVEAGDKFSAVFTLESQQTGDGFQMVIPVDESETEEYTENGNHLANITFTHVSHPGTSFFRLRDNSAWSQLDNGASLRIKAYTQDAPFELTLNAGAHGTAVLGDYTSKGYLVTATPDSGYYTSGYTILSGSASVIQNGNVLYVNPTEPTTIRIEFAEQTGFTLTYSVNGEQYGSAVTGTTGEAVILPQTVPAYEDYTFLGWITAPMLNAVPDKPLCFEPGTTYYPNGGNTTLYALYSFRGLAVPGQDGSYARISSSSEFTEGRYLIVNESALCALDGSKASTGGMWAPINTAPNYLSVTISGERIPDTAENRAADFHYDPETRQFYSSYGYPIGGYKNGYYFYVWGKTSTDAAQTVSFDGSGNAIIQDDYYHNYLHYYAESSAYFAYKTGSGDPVQLYRKTEDTSTTYYSTAFDAEPAVTWTVSFESNGGTAVAAQTVVNGQSAVRPTDPTKDGFDFAGWYKNSGLTEAYDFSAPVTASFTLYAKWTEVVPQTYTVSFESNGGSAVPPQTVTEGSTVTRPADPTKEGCSFAGWFTDTGLTELYNFSTPVHASFTLYAKWEDAQTPHTHTPGEPVQENQSAPSCTEPGSYDSVIYCTTCGAELSRETVPVDPLGHAWNEGTVTVKPTDSKDGERLYTCTRCNATETEVIPKLDRENPFVDVLLGSYYYDQVLWAYYHDPQITKGTDDTHFSPDAGCTRAQVATFLYAAAGKPAFEMPDASFTDVKEGDWYYKAVMWALSEGITAGMGEGAFGANVTCTRAQIVTFLYAAAGKPEFEMPDASFTDVKEGDWFYKPVMWALSAGVTAGMGNGVFGANSTCTRAQVVTFLYKAYGVNE